MFFSQDIEVENKEDPYMVVCSKILNLLCM